MMAQRHILIVGGGTAGWLTAAYLARAFNSAARGAVAITLVESPEIGIVGVGEGAFPTIRTTLEFLGIDEYDFVRRTNATFKQGIRFDDWAEVGSRFVHPFEAPLFVGSESLVAAWLASDPQTRPPFAEAVTIQHRVAAASRGPKTVEDGRFAAPLNYAYHFDAVKLAELLAERARELGVVHIADTLKNCEVGPGGSITGVTFERTGRVEADLYIDCTGLRAELIGQALDEPFVSVKNVLFTDRALACRVPYDCADGSLPSYTVAQAHEAGWLWDIGLRGARGVGCVYSSTHIDDDRVREVLAGYIGHPVEPRLIAFEPGYRARQWVGNCVAAGMAGGFLEPLESTGIVVIEAAAAMIADLLPMTGAVDASADRFNALMTARYASIVNFLKLHYALSRRDERFWRDNRETATIPSALDALLARWRSRPPSRFDFTLDVETFAYFNYQYILYGMGFAPAPTRSGAAGDEALDRVRQFGDQAARDLPSHRDLIEAINAAA